jgi:hypothetical protein
MVSEADIQKMIEQWKRGTHALRRPEQHHGENLVKILEQYDPSMLRLFDDYLEAGSFILFMGLLKDQDVPLPGEIGNQNVH